MVTTRELNKTSVIFLVAFLAACASNEAVDATATITPASSAPAAVVTPAGGQIVPGSAQDFQQNVGDRVLFGYDRSDLDEQGREVLRRQAAWLAQYPAVTLVVEGHADERGTREYNVALGARRAATVREYLASTGVSPSRLESVSYGKERPACTGSNDACWAQNRRGQSVIRSGAAS